MSLDNTAAYGQAQADAVDVGRQIATNPVETLEDPLKVLLGDPNALVGDGHQHLPTASTSGHPDVAAVGRVLHRIIQEIRDDLLDTSCICVRRQILWMNVQEDAVSLQAPLHRGRHAFSNPGDADTLAVQLHSLAFQPFQIQDPLDDAGQAVGLYINVRKKLLGGLMIKGYILAQ